MGRMEHNVTDREPALAQSLSLGDLKRAFWRSRGFILLAVVVCELLAAGDLMITTPRYPTDMLLAAQQTGSGQSGGSTGNAVGALGGLGGAASLLGLGGMTPSTDFEKFRVLYISSQTAQIVDQRYHLLQSMYPGWNARHGRWEMPPLGPGNALQRLIRVMFGRPAWRQPTADDLASLLGNQITIKKQDTDPFVMVSSESRDPKATEKLMLALADAANEILRRKAQQQATEQIKYLSHELETISNAEHRQVLTQLLSSQEQSLMLSRSNLPYAAQILTSPATHYDQGKPGITLTLAAGGIAGLLAGMFIAVLREASARSKDRVPRDSVEVMRGWLGGRGS